MTQLVFLLEEPSAKELLKGVLPKILPVDVETRFLVFEGKQDLEKQLVRKLNGWLNKNAVFVVLRDQDAAECKKVKQNLLELVRQSNRTQVLVRVACRELESWILGDWQAVSEAFDNPQLATQTRKAKFKNPDQLHNPVDELRRFLPEYQKRSGARLVGPLLHPDRNQSKSFQIFCRGLEQLVGDG